MPVGIGRFVNIAHRGASAHAPENSLAAMRQALALGADYVELDVQRSRDGYLVAFHDDTLERTTDGSGTIRGHELAALQALDAGRWFDRAHPGAAGGPYAGTRIATLDAIAAAVAGQAGLYIEAKGPNQQPGLEDDLIDGLERAGALVPDRLVLQAFEPASLARYAERAPAVPRVQLLDYRSYHDDVTVEARGLLPAPERVTAADFAALPGDVAGVAPNATAGARVLIGADFVAAAHAAGLFVHVYTVDEPALMQQLIAAGVDGLFTNCPDRLADLRPR